MVLVDLPCECLRCKDPRICISGQQDKTLGSRIKTQPQCLAVKMMGTSEKKCTSSQEHIIVHTNCSWNHAAKAHTREDVAIVGLQANHRFEHQEADSTNIYHSMHLKQCKKICKDWYINHTDTVQTTLMHYWHSNDLNFVPGQQHIPFPRKSQEQTDFHLQRCTFPAQNPKKKVLQNLNSNFSDSSTIFQ